jgi:hypothetical protein
MKRKQPLRAKFVDGGVTTHDWQQVDDIPYNSSAANMVKPAITETDGRTHKSSVPAASPVRKPADPPNLFISADKDPVAAAKWLSKAAIFDYGGDFMIIDTRTSLRSNESTDAAVKELNDIKRSETVRFGVMIIESELNESQRSRLDRLMEKVDNTLIPVVDVVLIPESDLLSTYEIRDADIPLPKK